PPLLGQPGGAPRPGAAAVAPPGTGRGRRGAGEHAGHLLAPGRRGAGRPGPLLPGRIARRPAPDPRRRAGRRGLLRLELIPRWAGGAANGAAWAPGRWAGFPEGGMGPVRA